MAYTPTNNPYAPGDPYSYDLKWMVEEVKKAQNVITTAEDAVNTATEQAIIAAANASEANTAADAANTSAQAAADSASAAADSAESILNVTDPMQQQIAVLSSRMDTFSSLTEGSTTGDAELQDIRVAANGSTYATAGDAVRGQIEYLGCYLEESTNILFFRSNTIRNYRGIYVTLQPDGTYLFNGTATQDTRIPFNGASSYSDPILPPGTYTFGLEVISGSASTSSNNDFSVRVGGNGTANITVRRGRGTYTATYTETASMQLYVASGVAFDNFKVRLWCNEGDTRLAFLPHKIPVDYIAREQMLKPLEMLSELLTQKYPLLAATAAARGQGGTIMDSEYVWIRQPTTSPGTGDFRYLNYINGYYHGSDAETSGITDENIGHAQDICYNPNEDSIYVITMKASGAVAKLNTSSLATYEATIYPLDETGNPYTSAAIAYNRNSQEYIIFQRPAGSEPGKLHFYDSNWIRTNTVEMDPWTIGLTTTQGMDTDGNYVYITIARKNSEANYTCYVLTYDLSGKLIEETNMIDFSNSDEGIEIEGIAYDWANGFFLCNCNRHLPTIEQQIYLIAPNNMARHGVGLTSFMLKKWAASESF